MHHFTGKVSALSILSIADPLKAEQWKVMLFKIESI